MPQFEVTHTKVVESTETVTYMIQADSMEEAQEISDFTQIDDESDDRISVSNRDTCKETTQYEASPVTPLVMAKK